MTVVIKFGGNAMVDADALQAFVTGVKNLAATGKKPVVVHGGGPQISAGLKAAGIVSEFKGGYRVTTSEAVTVVREVLVNEVNRELVHQTYVMTFQVGLYLLLPQREAERASETSALNFSVSRNTKTPTAEAVTSPS